MAYLLNTPDQQQEMLQQIGVESIADLFQTIPEHLQLKRDLEMGPALTEMECDQKLSELNRSIESVQSHLCFQGGGAYDHFIPAAVDELAGRGEFYTAYTPYQSEASQGTLQAFFEYQTLVCQLTGMDVSNGSLYEAATAVTEAILMAMRSNRREQKVVFAAGVHPEYVQTATTYLHHTQTELISAEPDGTHTSLETIEQHLDEQTACVVIQHPNFFGTLEDVSAIAEKAHAVGALVVMIFDPLSLGVLKRPGDLGADIAVAEGQGLGIPLQYGGPYLGIMACKKQFMRKMPGRLIGQTTDRNGKRSFVLNLQAREQHIRRDKATSNICTNQGLMALRSAIYLSLLGPQGVREVGERCVQNAHYAATCIDQIDDFRVVSDRPFFKEFVVRCTLPRQDVIAAGQKYGLRVGPWLTDVGTTGLPDQEQLFLVAVTEKRSRQDIDRLVEALRSCANTANAAVYSSAH